MALRFCFVLFFNQEWLRALFTLHFQSSVSSLSLDLSADASQYDPFACVEEIFSLPLNWRGQVIICSDSLSQL